MNKFLVFLVGMLVIACSDNAVYDQFVTVNEEAWNVEQPIAFEVEIQDTIQPKNAFIQVRNNTDYPYSNLYLITKIKTPQQQVVIDTLEYEMADAFGRWLGDGVSDVKTSKLWFLENYPFSQKGTYTFEIAQAMRTRGELKGLQALPGITELGLRIETIETH